MTTDIGYLKSLDGVRAASILLVILAHTFPLGPLNRLALGEIPRQRGGKPMGPLAALSAPRKPV